MGARGPAPVQESPASMTPVQPEIVYGWPPQVRLVARLYVAWQLVQLVALLLWLTPYAGWAQ